jgi:hypothetical protein
MSHSDPERSVALAKDSRGVTALRLLHRRRGVRCYLQQYVSPRVMGRSSVNQAAPSADSGAPVDRTLVPTPIMAEDWQDD